MELSLLFRILRISGIVTDNGAMRLSSKGEYALLALLYLSQRWGSGPVPTHRIAEASGAPKKFLEQILLTLKRAGFLQSRMGPEGGYQLARPPDQVVMAEVIRLMDGPLAAVGSVSEKFHASTPIERSRALLGVFKEIRDYTAAKLESTTFADLAAAENMNPK
jgi:Rrf2 family cysteine metabolism transcriptional repressor